MKEVKVIGCKRVSLRKHPWITTEAEEVAKDFLVSELPKIYAVTKDKEFSEGLDNYVDMRITCYDWVDNKFYSAKLSGTKGWINASCLEVIQND